MLPYLWRHFEYCGLYNNNEEELQNDLLAWVYKYENITIKF